jgi:MOSC domain-containing protein YiiM
MAYRSAILEVSQPRQPCFKLGIRMNDDRFPGTFALARRPGLYLRIVSEGALEAGDTIEVNPTERPAIQIGSLEQSDIAREVLSQAVNDPRVPDSWRQAAARALRLGT